MLDVIALDPEKLKEASRVLTQCLDLCDKKRRHGFGRFVFKQDYDSYTDDEVRKTGNINDN